MALDKHLKKVIHLLAQWPVTISTQRLVKEIQEIIKDLRDHDPYQTYLFIQFIRSYVNLASYRGKYQNRSFVEVLVKSLLESCLGNKEAAENFYIETIQSNPIYESFAKLSGQLVEHQLIFISGESEALQALNKELDTIILKNPHVRRLIDAEQTKTKTVKSKPRLEITSKATLANFILLIPAILSHFPAASAQELASNSTNALISANEWQQILGGLKANYTYDLSLQKQLEKYYETITPATEDVDYPFHRAVRLNLKEIIHKFVNVVEVDVRDGEQRTPLHVACITNNLNMVKYLLERGADINAKDKEQWTGLHRAVSYGHLEIVRKLLSHSPKITAAGPQCITPFMVAVDNRYYEIAQLFLDHIKAETYVDINWYEELKQANPFLKENRYADAMPILDNYLKKNATNFEEGMFWVSVLEQRAHLHFILGKREAAIEDLATAISLYPQRSVTTYCFYIDLLVRQNKLELALKKVEEGLSFFPEHKLLLERQEEIHKKIGDSYFNLKDAANIFENYQKALENYRKALQMDPMNSLYEGLVTLTTYLSDRRNTLKYYLEHYIEFTLTSILQSKTIIPAVSAKSFSQDPQGIVLDELIPCAEKFKDDRNLITIKDLYIKAREDNKAGRAEAALKKLKTALELATELVKDPGVNLYISAIYNELARAYLIKKEKDYEKAFEAHLTAHYLAPGLPFEKKHKALETYRMIIQDWIKEELRFEENAQLGDINSLEQTFLAAATNDVNRLRLIETPQVINRQNVKGMTPMIVAVRHNALEFLKEIVSRGDVNIKDFQGQTALHWAAKQGNYRAIEILAKADANLEVEDNTGRTPLNIAIQGGYKEAAQMLFSKISGKELPEEIFASWYDIEGLKKFTKVIDWLCSKNNPRLNNILKQLFFQYFFKNKALDLTTSEAIKMLDRALQLFPTDSQLLSLRIIQLAAQKNYQETIEKCHEVIQLYSELAIPYLYLMSDCINRGDYDEAEKYSKRLLPKSPLQKSSFYEEVQTFLKRFRDFFQENNTLSEILTRDNSNIIETSDLTEEQSFLRSVFQPNLKPNELIHNLHNKTIADDVNKLWSEEFNSKESIEEKVLIIRKTVLHRIIEILKQENDAYYNLALSNVYGNLGLVYFHLKNAGDAKQAWETAIALGANRGDVYFNYGNIVLENNRNHAYLAFKKAVKIDPNNSRYQKKLDEVIQLYKNSKQPLPDEPLQSAKDELIPNKIESEQNASWIKRFIFGLSIIGVFHLWRQTTKDLQGSKKEAEKIFSDIVLKTLNSLTKHFYEKEWQWLEANKFKLANLPKLSIQTALVKSHSLKLELQKNAVFTINPDILKNGLVETLQIIFGKESVDITNDAYFLLVVPSNYRSSDSDAYRIKLTVDTIVDKLAESSPEVTNVKEKLRYQNRFKKLSPNLEVHEKRLTALANMRELFLDKGTDLPKTHEKVLEKFIEYQNKAINFDVRKNKELIKANNKVSENVKQLIDDINRFINPDASGKDNVVGKNNIENFQKQLKDYANILADAKIEVKRDEKSEVDKATRLDLDKVEKTLKEAEERYGKGTFLKRLCGMNDLWTLVEKAISERDAIDVEIERQFPDKSSNESKSKTPPEPEVPSKSNAGESNPSEVKTSKDQENKEEATKESKKEKGGEEEKVKETTKITPRKAGFFSKLPAEPLIEEKRIVINPYKYDILIDKRTKVAKDAMDVLLSILKNVDSEEFNINIDDKNSDPAVFAKVHYGINYNIMRLMYSLGLLGVTGEYLKKLLVPNQVIKIRHNLLKRSYMAHNETFIKINVVEKNGVKKQRKQFGKLLISALKVVDFLENPVAELDKYGQFHETDFLNMDNDFLLNGMSQINEKTLLVRKFARVCLKNLHYLLSVVQILLDEKTVLDEKFLEYAKRIILNKLIPEVAYCVPYLEEIDKELLLKRVNSLRNVKKLNEKPIIQLQSQLLKWHRLILSSDIVCINDIQIDLVKIILDKFSEASTVICSWEVAIRKILSANLLNSEEKNIEYDYTEFCLQEVLCHSRNLELLCEEAVGLPYVKYFNDAILLSALRMAATLVGQNIRSLPTEVRINLVEIMVSNIPDLQQGPKLNRFEYVRDCVGHKFFERGDAVCIKEGRYFVFDEAGASYTLDLAKHAKEFYILVQKFLDKFQKDRHKRMEDKQELELPDEIKYHEDESISQLKMR